MFSPVPLINRIDRLKESENRITLDDIWDYPVRPQRFSMWSGRPSHPHAPPSRRPARGSQQPTISSALPSLSPARTLKNDLNLPAKPCRITTPHYTRATLPSALRFEETYGSASPPCVHIRRPAQYRRLSPITSRTPRGPQKAGPCDARPSSLKWRIPVHHEGAWEGEEVGVVPSIAVTAPDDKGDTVCPLPSDANVDGGSKAETGAKTTTTGAGMTEGDARTHHLRRTTTRILGPEKSDLSSTFPSRDIQSNSAHSPAFNTSADLAFCAPQAEEDFTLPEDYASTLRLSIIDCPRRKRAWRVVERCLDGVWRRVGW
ncbi:hypothetical protein KC345_g9110 [Hortaea werneckii]|nr:hypothetical protein KC345_g9110 [Hortaea werneckii]